MDTLIQWLPILITVSMWVIIFYCRHFLVAYIKSGVEHDFNLKLETLKSELRSRESEISTLRDTVLTGRNQRQALVDKRRIEAVETLWKGVVELQRFKALSNAMVAINMEVATAESAKDSKVRQLFEMLNKFAPPIETLKPSTVSCERPFVSPVAWAYFSALQTILYGSFARAKALEFGVKDINKFMNTEHEKKLLKAALPHQKEFIDKFDSTAYFYLIEELEEALLKELNNIMDGKASDQESLKRASEIQKEINQMAKDSGSR